MKERPILFSAPMVRALLEGGKTQTRRILKPQPFEVSRLYCAFFNPTVIDRYGEEQPGAEIFGAYDEYGEFGLKCPYGAPGARLWVRETWCHEYSSLTGRPVEPPRALYAATETRPVIEFDDDGFTVTNKDGSEKSPWRPSIHMPRWASRITLEITAVRVERLRSITCADAIAEGCAAVSLHNLDCASPDPRDEYRTLWESINGAGSWDMNPWVWVVEFKRLPDQSGAAADFKET